MPTARSSAPQSKRVDLDDDDDDDDDEEMRTTTLTMMR
jgi:hypothetical protein